MEKLEFISFEEALREQMKLPGFKEGYHAEINRLRVAYQLKMLRKKKKLTQRQVAEKAKMPQSVIARLESGTHGVSLDTLYRIADVFDKQVGFVEPAQDRQ